MKVFSREKYLRNMERFCPINQPMRLTFTWPFECDGKTKEECNALVYGIHPNWMEEKEEWEASRNQDTATIKGSKLEYHLLPPEQLAGMAEIMNHGVKTHKTGYMDLDPLLYWNATMRHLMALRRGELTDEEGNSHALAIACNGAILDRQLKAGKELRFE